MTTQQFLRRVRALFSRSEVERELGDEMEFHLEMEITDLVRTRGLSRADATREARLRFGGIDRHTEAHRDARGVRWIEDGIADLRYAARSLLRAPAFAVSTILVLALGIGASTAIFSAVNAVIVSHLPYPDDERLIRIYNASPPTSRWALSVVDYRAIVAQQRTLTSVGAMTVGQAPVVAGSAEPSVIEVHPVTAGLFDALGVHAAAGRAILPSDEVVSSPPVVVISDGFATASFGSASAAVGKMIRIDGSARQVVGVLPPGRRELAGFHCDVFPAFQPSTPTRRGPFGIVVVGRMRTSATLDATASDLKSISRRIYPLWAAGFQDSLAHYVPVPLRDAIIGDAPKTLWMFAGAAILLLLTAVMNVTNLMLARMTTRIRELSLRAVLGASRWRLARLVVAETTLISIVGAVGGVIASVGLLRVLVTMAARMPRIGGATIDGRALTFAMVVGLVVGVVIGIHPVLTLACSRGVHSGNRDIGLGRHGSSLRGALVAAEFALALPLLAGAGQLIQSIGKLQRVDPGFDPAHLAYAQVILPRAVYDSAYKVTAYWRRAINDLSGIPGVTAVGFTTELPPTDVGNMNDFQLEGSAVTPGGAAPMSPWLVVSPGFFDAMGMRLVAGRMFTGADTAGVNNALIVSESFVKNHSSDRPAIGRRVFEGGCNLSCVPLYIVGVVSDVKYNGMNQNGDAAYWPSTLGQPRSGYLMIRTTGSNPGSVVASVGRAIRELDQGAPPSSVGLMTDRMYQSTAAPRHWTMLLAAFAIAALTLAAVGIFGLLSYLVTTMRREIGVRVALGAQRGEIARMVVGRGLANSVFGVVLGLGIAVAGRQLLAASLYDVAPGDPATLIVVALGLLGVALGASWIPARQASRIDPMTAIRTD